MRKLRVLSITAVAAVLLLAAVPAAASPTNSPVQYSIKFVCGFMPVQPVGEEGPVKPGNYATAINIHNYTPTQLQVSLRVSLHYRDGGTVPPILSPRVKKARRFRTLEIDCRDIWAIAQLPSGTFVKGNVHLGLPVPLDISAVYTSQTNLGPGAALDAGAGISIDVEYVKPFLDMTTP